MSELPVDALISVAQAIRIIDSTSVTPRIERVSLVDSLTRRLAERIVADRDDPPFDKSQMDGYAIRAGESLTLRIIGDIPAGAGSTRSIAAGEAMSIMTGAPLPPGADAVIPIEATSRDADRLFLNAHVKAGNAIARRGTDCVAGTVLLNAGTIMGPAQIAVAASAGADTLQVFAKPRVAILSTGNEIVPVDISPTAHQIRNTNSSLLIALLTSLGCAVTDLGIARDSPDELRQLCETGFSACDVLFVSGGMSMGTYDYVPRVLAEMGFDIRISKLRIKPGKPFVFATIGATRSATRGEQFVFGLPGNPVSAFVCTVRLAARLLARMEGGVPKENWMTGYLAEALPMNGPREFYQPVVIERSATHLSEHEPAWPLIRPLKWKASSDIYTLAAANALLVRTENESALSSGALVRVLRWD